MPFVSILQSPCLSFGLIRARTSAAAVLCPLPSLLCWFQCEVFHYHECAQGMSRSSFSSFLICPQFSERCIRRRKPAFRNRCRDSSPHLKCFQISQRFRMMMMMMWSWNCKSLQILRPPIASRRHASANMAIGHRTVQPQLECARAFISSSQYVLMPLDVVPCFSFQNSPVQFHPLPSLAPVIGSLSLLFSLYSSRIFAVCQLSYRSPDWYCPHQV